MGFVLVFEGFVVLWSVVMSPLDSMSLATAKPISGAHERVLGRGRRFFKVLFLEPSSQTKKNSEPMHI